VQLKAEAPEHKSLKSLQNKYSRLKTRIDKKLGSSGSSAPAKPTPAQAAAGAAQATDKLSHGAKSNLKKAARELDFAEQELAKGEKSLQSKQFNLVDSYVFNAKAKVEAAGGLLDKVVTNNKANPKHPEVVAAFTRHEALQTRVATFSGNAQGAENSHRMMAAKAKEEDAALSAKWLPEITPFTETASASRLQYPGSYNAQELKKQEGLYQKAKKLLGEVEKAVPADSQPHDLKQAVDKLRFAVQVYEEQQQADNANRLQPIENTLSQWEVRFAANKQWTEGSDQGLFVIPKKKLEHQQQQITALGKVNPDSAAGFRKRLAVLEKENSGWEQKKRQWLERPRPFPQAKMKSAKLESEMKQLLKDRGIKVQEFAIVDKDWWVQAGEFRYVTTAVLSKDDNGKYWSNVSFRQVKTLAGYGPTEIFDVDEIRIRLP
jgi:hypothetical protein